jgi:hypothetical protein
MRRPRFPQATILWTTAAFTVAAAAAGCAQPDEESPAEPLAKETAALFQPLILQQFCGQYAVDYDDASTTIGDDFFTDNTPKPARGAKINVTRNSDGVCLYCDFTPYDGADAGCTPKVAMSPNETYTIKMLASASVAGQSITVGPDDAVNGVYEHVHSTGYVPTASFPSVPVQFVTKNNAAWNIAAAAGWAIQRRPINLSGETFNFYTQPCPGGSSNCNSGGNIYIVNDKHKYVIVHELGHAVAKAANGGQNARSSYDAPEDNCPSSSGHSLASKEYQSAAANEGIASYYAAVAFNDPHGADCAYQLHYQIDMDHNKTTANSLTLSCDDGGTQGIAAGDYLGEFCVAQGESINRGTQYDWIRFFWDLDSKEGLDAADIFTLWTAASPHTWNATGDVWDVDNPAVRLEAAAAGLGQRFEDAWAHQVIANGVYR